MQRHSGTREQLVLEEPAGSEAEKREVPVGMHVASSVSLAKAPGCHAGGFELYPKVMGTQVGFKQESECPGQSFLCLAWSSSLKPPDRMGVEVVGVPGWGLGWVRGSLWDFEQTPGLSEPLSPG